MSERGEEVKIVGSDGGVVVILEVGSEFVRCKVSELGVESRVSMSGVGEAVKSSVL